MEKAGEMIKSHLRNPAKGKEEDEAVDDPDNDVEDADEERGEEEDLPGLHHAKDDCGVDEHVGDRPDDRPNPVSWKWCSCHIVIAEVFLEPALEAPMKAAMK